jgi:hypothetical protein
VRPARSPLAALTPEQRRRLAAIQRDPRAVAALDRVLAAERPARSRAATAVVTSAQVEADGVVALRLDGLRLVNVANARENWRVRTSRVAREHAAVSSALRGVALPAGPRWRVTITREGPRALDDDGLTIACKGVRDAVAAALGCDDGPTGPVVWQVAQARATGYAVTVRVRGDDDAVGT